MILNKDEYPIPEHQTNLEMNVMKYSQKNLIKSLSLAVLLQLGLAIQANAAPITVPNFSFESGLTDWSGSGDSGTFTPTVGTNGFVAADGTQAAYVFTNGDSAAQEIYSSASLATIALNETYTLTVAMGYDLSSTYNNSLLYDSGNIALLANGSAISGASLTGIVPPTGSMTNYTVSFSTAGGLNAGLVGDALTIQLGQDAGAPGGTYPTSEFDNVRLDGTAAVATVPEPSTWAMMLGGLGCLMALTYRRRMA